MKDACLFVGPVKLLVATGNTGILLYHLEKTVYIVSPIPSMPEPWTQVEKKGLEMTFWHQLIFLLGNKKDEKKEKGKMTSLNYLSDMWFIPTYKV